MGQRWATTQHWRMRDQELPAANIVIGSTPGTDPLDVPPMAKIQDVKS
jgi:hypothetical protein